jgi:hypothetical protein
MAERKQASKGSAQSAEGKFFEVSIGLVPLPGFVHRVAGHATEFGRFLRAHALQPALNRLPSSLIELRHRQLSGVVLANAPARSIDRADRPLLRGRIDLYDHICHSSMHTAPSYIAACTDRWASLIRNCFQTNDGQHLKRHLGCRKCDREIGGVA